MGLKPLLQQADEFLRTKVAPEAIAIDQDPEALRAALGGLCGLGAMALRRPAEFGGPAISERDFRDFQVSVARTSGSLAFLQTQHQSAVSMIAKGDNSLLKSEALPRMHDGSRLVGIGFSQLRRPDPPLLTAEKAEGGYRLAGHAPWVTGLSFFPEFLVGAALPSGEAVFGIVPFEERPGIRLGPVMRLAAMESPQTVTVDFDDWFLPDPLVAFLKPPGWIHENDLINITVQGFFAIGCALAGLDVVLRGHERRPADFMLEAHERLSAEVADCRAAMTAAIEESTEDMTTEEKLRVRAWAIELAGRCALAGVAATGGSANSVRHNAQRVYREALVYAVSAQTTPIMRATLERLSGSR